jgi:hypothetical protein
VNSNFLFRPSGCGKGGGPNFSQLDIFFFFFLGAMVNEIAFLSRPDGYLVFKAADSDLTGLGKWG